MKLAELIIDLKANSAQLTRDFEQAHKQATEFASKIGETLATLGIGFGVGEIAESLKGITEYEDKIGHMAISAGMTAQQMSGLAFAVKDFDIPLQEVSMGLAYFDKILSGLIRSKAGATAIQELGLSLDSLRKQDSHQALLTIADAFHKLPDGAQKAGLAAALFGTTVGMQLVPFLDQGSAGISALEAKARELGVTLSETDVDAAAQAKMAMVELGSALDSLKMRAAAELFPSLTLLAEILIQDKYAAAEFRDELKLLELGLEAEVVAVGGIIAHGLTWAALGEGSATKAIDKWFGDIEAKFADRAQTLVEDQRRQLNNMHQELIDLSAKPPGVDGVNAAPYLNLGGKGRTKVDQVKNSLKELQNQLLQLTETKVDFGLDKLRQEGATQAQLDFARALLQSIEKIKSDKTAHDQLTAATANYRDVLESLKPPLDGVAAAQKDFYDNMWKLLRLEQQGVDVTDGLAANMERYARAMAQSTEASRKAANTFTIVPFDMSAASAGDQALTGLPFGQTNAKAPKGLDKMRDSAEQLGKTMSSSFEKMLVSGKGFENMLTNLLSLFAEFIIKTIVFKDIANALNGGAGQTGSGLSGLIGSFFSGLAGGKAAGGPVTAGEMYMVGEQGPEIFAPGMSGTIIPNGASGGSGGGQVNIDARGADAGVEYRVMRAMEIMGKRALGQSLVLAYEYRRRGGNL